MPEKTSVPPEDLERVIESAKRLGVEINEADALQWLAAMASQSGQEIQVDERSGVFGSRISMLDFSDAELDHFRQLGRIVEFSDLPGKVETALALSGSAAQNKIQTYPGDADFFERVNILADTRGEACIILANIIREKALNTFQSETYKLMEVRMGSYPFDLYREGKLITKGSSISWTPEEVQVGIIQGNLPGSGNPVKVEWDTAAQDPGWCKLDWVVADPARKQLVNASNMLDVTWEAPDGSITPLDGYLDSFFQEVYLDAASIPIFSKLVKHVSGDALDDYVEQLEHEIRKYISKNPNYGKAAKRMYNVFRLTGRYVEAAYVRELFDEPTTMLYQIGALIRTIDESFQPDSVLDKSTILTQADQLILSVTEVLEGAEEVEVVRHLLRLRNLLADDLNRGELSPQANAARAEVINIVNNFFYEKLTGIPTIQAYLDGLQE